MVWNFFSKLWPVSTDSENHNNVIIDSNNSNSNTKNNSCISINQTVTPINHNFLSGFNHFSLANSEWESELISITTTHAIGLVVTPASSLGVTDDSDMDRQRSTKRSSFRMRISRRIRSGFMPVPQYDSDSDFTLEGSSTRDLEFGSKTNESEAFLKGDSGGRKNERDEKKGKDGHKQKPEGGEKKEDKNRLGVKITHLGGSVRGTKKEKEIYDLTVSAEAELGYTYRSRKKSFGSESEKRRGERFQRREIEKRGTLEVSDIDDDSSSSSSESHTCDFRCPLIIQGECPGSQAFKKKLLQIEAQRRSSFTSSTSRESGLASASGPSQSRRPHPLASLSIDDIPGKFGSHDYGSGAPIKSPGLLSTASMWSTSDLHHGMGGLAGKEQDSASHGGTNSLSNVSGSFSERMHELVRAFSSRTQRTKEKISQPPTPSSDSDYDAKSGASCP